MTFETLHKVLSAERALRAAQENQFRCRPTPTPPGLSESICGMSLEVLDQEQQCDVLQYLASKSLSPSGIYQLD